jgi:hypothetical protein
MISKTYTVTQHGNVILEITISLPEAEAKNYTNFQWDSSTGLVTALRGAKRVVVPSTGKSLGQIEPGPYEITNVTNVRHNFWYY